MRKKLPARFPAEVSGYLAASREIYSSEVTRRVNAALAERGQLITTVGGKPVRVPLAFPEHIDAALDDLLMATPEVAVLVRATRKVRHGR